jgi:hypothetical protein
MLMLALTVIVGSSEAQTKVKMKYLVIGEAVDAGPMLQPGQVTAMIEQAIIPSLDMLAKWEADKKIVGGLYVGDRKGVFILEAESNDEVDKMLESLPFWGLLKWNVSALQSFESRSTLEKTIVEKMKTMKK